MHVLKNIVIPVVTVLGLELGSMIAFAVVTETVFAYPGMGKLLIDSINRLDRPIVVAYLMLIVVIFVVINLAVDLSTRRSTRACGSRKRRLSDGGPRRQPPAPPQLRPARPVLRREPDAAAPLGPSRAPERVPRLAVLVAARARRARVLVAPQNPYDLAQLDIMDGMLPPGATGDRLPLPARHGRPGPRHVFGHPVRAAHLADVGAVSVFIACAIGASVGVVAAYAGGRIETVLMRIVDLQLSFPAILVALVLLAVSARASTRSSSRSSSSNGPTTRAPCAAARWSRSAANTSRRRAASRCRRRASCFRHLLPNCLPPLIVVAHRAVARAIALEATLSFLGVGVPVTEPSLGC